MITVKHLEELKAKGLIQGFTDPKKPENSIRSKYGNKKVQIGELSFDSKKEARRWQELRIMATLGEISNLQLQVPFQLSVCKYIADFVYMDLKTGGRVVEDVKGFKNRTYLLKKKLMKAELGIEIKEV